MRRKWSLRFRVCLVLVAVAVGGVLLSACGTGVDASGGAVLPPSSDVERAELDESAPFADLAVGFNDAGFDFWRTQTADENLVFSPVSIAHTLLMARAAADETTGSAIDALFELPGGQEAHEAWNTIDLMLNSDADTNEEITITIADRVWPAAHVSPSQAWLNLLASHHGATVQTLDFAGDPEASRDVINLWVSEQTDGLIPELVPEGMVNDQTLVMLADAVYFGASWATAFLEDFNEPGEFIGIDGTSSETEYMHIQTDDRVAAGEGFVAAEIPYSGEAFNMVVIVPHEDEFIAFRDRIDQDLIDEVDALLTSRTHHLFLPKWKSTTSLNLGTWLAETGISPGSYPGIDPEAFIGGAVHAAEITVDEEGTVAAAATAIDFEGAEPPQPELTIRVDRPFYYLIRHQPTGLVLFAGQLTQPTTS